MRNYHKELEERVAFIRSMLIQSGAGGIVYGNSGGKDSALVGILCKRACENTVGVIMPCQSSRNFNEDRQDALAVATAFDIEVRSVDLSECRSCIERAVQASVRLTGAARANIAPRLRMITLYALAASENRLVAGTGNRSEAYMGYFTKWGDGAYDFNPIGDLTVQEIYAFLAFLHAPENILTKAPSAGLFEGQTDEGEMGVSYAAIDAYLLDGIADANTRGVMEAYHSRSEHKRRPSPVFAQTK